MLRAMFIAASFWMPASFGIANDAAVAASRAFTFEPSSLEQEIPATFRLPEATVSATEEAVSFDLARVTFPSPVASGHATNDVVHAEFYPAMDVRGKTGRRPAVIFLHYLDGNLALPRLFCKMFATKGVSSLLVKMPYYHERRVGTDRRMISPDAELTAAAVRQAVLDVRYALAYLRQRPEIDPQRIGIAGISLGGIVGSLAFELEPRLERGCFLLAGGDIATMLWDSELTSKYRGEWEAAGVTKADLAGAFSQVDPATYPGRRAGRPVLLLAGRGDATVPEVCTKALVQALDEPETVWFEGGHAPKPADVADAMLRVMKFFE
ncbi:MAG: prolyl oligopeptidase family serine peptidase [Planctomycetaceae bacterium]|nr:prolyl oligopeptidase family serine peptidase [Planctomycetaceae bacterium]